ncbi:hypothetical protein [Enterococcus rivorum]|uniref:Uncharacterized protein n=2 Tax=Enterococcus rivorum TaxID=762845 RepID=A0A1E5KUS5_9ENTE|nr:hypothetical protein [Enterococcus rivorum]OEH81624.1 hypothetical protein BCR26_16265 [Enterococcus rivorum]
MEKSILSKKLFDSINALEESLKKKWSTVDKSVTNFYQNIHNGFYDFTCKSMGLDSADNIESMGDYEWEYKDQLKFDTTYLYNFFSNGMGDYIALDENKPIENGSFLWSKSELPKMNLNFWDMIDEWIIVGLDN